ncbi:hypothetical protein DYB32_007077 [Aphanomyces invadans]|uniref:MHD domain-containing protein n=1 Tax=Aphanomyces invadans TaxID=157072 RepID=A0A3R7A605_9STRA|nr:hypothetical protein DYB32_007077 [Aphanomyces invadans]
MLGQDVPPIISTGNHYLISAFREDLFVLAVITNETSPLFVIEFLHRVVAVFREYFGKFEESVIKDNFSTVYQLLEEMLDNGYPLTTEPNALKAMVAPPPGVVGRLAAMGRSGVSESLPDGALSNMPWRKAGVKYSQVPTPAPVYLPHIVVAQNEIYFDVVEEIDAIVDAHGEMLQCEVHGSIKGNCRLSGVPDLTMVFRDPSVIDDCSFHPCVRYSRYEHERVISFVPPDGHFELMQYRVHVNHVVPPILCQPSVTYDKIGTGSVDLTLLQRHMPTLVSTSSKKALKPDNVSVEIVFPSAVQTVHANTNHGSCLFDDVTKTLTWTVVWSKKVMSPTCHGTVVLEPNAGIPDDNPIVLLRFSVPLSTVSGLTVDSLVLSNEKYTPYKGVRTLTKTGRFQIRT